MCICVEVPAGESVDAIPVPLLRKYISYARQYVQPSLSPEAAKTLQAFYLSLRAQAHSADSTPITTRQLESLIRLTEARSLCVDRLLVFPFHYFYTHFVVFVQARARLELRETATNSDAEDVVDIMKHR